MIKINFFSTNLKIFIEIIRKNFLVVKKNVFNKYEMSLNSVLKSNKIFDAMIITFNNYNI